MTILYITQNGITTHIGASQVAPYLVALARSGYAIKLLSSEPEGSDKLVWYYESLFKEVGIRWTRVPYRNKPAILGPLITQFRLSKAARRIVSQGGVKIIHCRSHPTAVIGYRLKQKFGLKFIFDFRDFYADWGLQNTHGIKLFLYKRLKKLEGPMIRAADKVVCLSLRASTILEEEYLMDQNEGVRRFQVIPCCADFSHFDLSKVSRESISLTREKFNLPKDALVLLYLGTLGADYMLTEMFALFRQLQRVQPNSYFLFVSNNGLDLVLQECANQEVSVDRIRFTSTTRELVPEHIAISDISVIFMRPGSRIGGFPIKIAELFACNMPVIVNRGVGDLDSIIDPAINGSVLIDDFSDSTLLDALRAVLSLRSKAGVEIKIRENSRAFALEEGVSRYSRVYSELLYS